jgi:Tfp pilus assembly protein PilF
MAIIQHPVNNTVNMNNTMNPNHRILLALALGIFALVGSGCAGDQIEATNELVKQQQTQIEQQQQEIDALKTNQASAYTPGVASPSGGCDRGVEATATQRGGERFAASDFNKALLYYNDALTACPADDRAEVNVARTYEALGNKVAAIKHYRKAAESNGPTVSDASDQAKAALVRLQASQMP